MTGTTTTNSNGNEIGPVGKIFAGIMFIAFIVLAIVCLVGFWPEQLPKAGAPDLYRNEFFHVRLLAAKDSCKKDSTAGCDYVRRVLDSVTRLLPAATDSAGRVKRKADSVRLYDAMCKACVKKSDPSAEEEEVISLSTLLILLVAVAGFLGTMIHTSSSFLNFVGAEKLKSGWFLWYWVKPVTGAGLAVVIYFVFRAGFLGFNDSSSINLYGIITMAALAGLFTDKATLKLEEVFAVIFKPKDERPDKLDKDGKITVSGIKPAALVANSANDVVISGAGFDKAKLVIKIDDDVIGSPVIKADSVSFSYMIPAGSVKKEFVVRILDDKGVELYKNVLPLKQ